MMVEKKLTMVHSKKINYNFNPPTPEIQLSILPLADTKFLVNWLPEFGVRSRQQLIPYKFEYSHYLSAEQCMVIIIGRRYMLINSMRR